jgi:glycosyltransferase involved in cell wall biosynthesis
VSQELTLLYVHGSEIGYARLGTYLAQELFKRGITVYDDDGRPPAEKLERKSAEKKVTDGRNPAPSPTNVISWVSVPTHASGFFDGQFKSILTMWESMSIPESFRETLHEFNVVMVPSPQNVELFSTFHDNVKLVTLGVDPETWHYVPPPPVHATFDFMVAGRGERKGVDVVYEAFQTVFGQWWEYDDNEARYIGNLDKPIPRLIMKSLKGHGRYYAPGIKHVTGKISDEAEADLYRSIHCYVQPSRGEGFGLQPLQAIALGRPTILTAAHGHESYAHLGIGIGSRPTKAGEFIYGPSGDWWEPDFEEVCEAMWDVYEHYDTHTETAKASAAVVAREFTWSNTTDQYLAAHGDELTKAYTGDGTWTRAQGRLYRIVTNEDHMSHAAGTYRHFEKGVEYWDIADIKRILYDAGKLDPSCLIGDDLGLAPEQMAGLDEYVSAKSFCPSCQQPLNGTPGLGEYLFQIAELEAKIRELEAERVLA